MSAFEPAGIATRYRAFTTSQQWAGSMSMTLAAERSAGYFVRLLLPHSLSKMGDHNFDLIAIRREMHVFRHDSLHKTGTRTGSAVPIIPDVAMLERSQVRPEAGGGHIFFHAHRNGAPIGLPLYSELQRALECLPLPRGATGDCRYFFLGGNRAKRQTTSRPSRQRSRRCFAGAVWSGRGASRGFDEQPTKIRLRARSQIFFEGP
jgi:hypothetical protein